MLHGVSRFEGSEYGVSVDGRALKNLITKGVRKRIQDRGAPASYGRFAHATGADWCLRIRNIERRPLHIDGHIQYCWRLVLVKARREHGAVVRVVHPLLANRMSNPQNGPSKDLTAKRAGMNYRAYVGIGEEIHDVILACFDVDLDLGKAGNVRKCRAVPRVIVLGGCHQTLSRKRRYGCLREFMEVGGCFMAIVDATQLNGVLRGFRQSHAGASTLTEYALVGDIVSLWLAAEFLRRDFLELLLGVHRGRVRRACHCVGRLAAAGNASERQVVRRVAPCNVALLPRNSQNLGACTVNVDHRFRPQVADSRLEGYSAIGLDDQNPIETDRATDKTTERDADTAHLGTEIGRASCRERV